MVNGCIVIKKGKEILQAFCSNNADFGSWFFSIARELFLTTDQEKFKKSIVVRLDELDGIRGKKTMKKFYARSKKNKLPFYPQITYEYDEKRQRLTLYFDGRKAIAFDRNKIDYFDFFVRNYRRIIQAFGRVYKTYMIDEKQAWVAFRLRMKQNRTLADIERDIGICIAKNSVIIGEQDLGNFYFPERSNPIHFYDKYGNNEYTARVEFFQTHATEKVKNPYYTAVIDGGEKSYPLFNAPSIKTILRRIAKKLKNEDFVNALRQFCKLQKIEEKLKEDIRLQKETKSEEKQKEEIEKFVEKIGKEINEIHSTFKNENFSILGAKDFSLSEREMSIISALYKYKQDIESPKLQIAI